MTNKEILNIALIQQARDSGCDPKDFLSGENKIVISKQNENARHYLNLPFFCDLCSYGTNIVASVDERILKFVEEYLDIESVCHCFETPRIHKLTQEFEKYGKLTCFMAEYFLPDVDVLKALPCKYEIRILTEFEGLYTKEWSNALCESRKHLDVLAAAAFDGDRIIGLAGCSRDCEDMWQIGVDVLPECRGRGIASALTSRLAVEILNHGKVPFYCCAWSNIASVRNAIKSGFRPAWVQMTAIDKEKAMSFM